MATNRRAFLRLATIGLVTAGCAAPAASPTAAPAPTVASKPAPTTAAPTPAAKVVPTTAPAKPAPAASPAVKPATVKVRLVQSIQGLPFAPVSIARAKNFFADEGIDLDWQLVQGAAAAAAALTGGDAQFSAGASTEVITLTARGVPGLAIAGIATKMTIDTVVSKKYAESKSVTPQAPLRQRITALKGAKLGITSPGGAPDRYARWLMTQAGLSPDDIENIRIGGTAEIQVALRQGVIDGFLQSAPGGQQMEVEGVGVILIKFTDVPEFDEFVHETLNALKSYSEQNRNVVERTARAIVRGSAFIHESPAEAKKILQEEFKGIDPKVIDNGVDSLTPAFPKDGKMTQKQWDNTIKVHVESGAIEKPLDTKEGAWWTNEYLKPR